MKELIKKVEEFHKIFEIPIGTSFKNLTVSESSLRWNLMDEENKEYIDVCCDNNLIEIADSLGDKLYVLLGTIIQHGLQDKIEDIFNLIHENNMSKLHNGKVVRDENGKVKKPDNFKSVDLTKIIN